MTSPARETAAPSPSSRAPVIVIERDPLSSDGDTAGNGWPAAPVTVSPGQMVVLTGPPGCGKSHLLRSAAGLCRDPGRRVTVASRDLGLMSHRRRRQAISETKLFHLPQEAPLLSNLTVLENILLPVRYLGGRQEEEAIQEALVLLRASGIEWAAGDLPARLSDEDRRTAALLRGFLRRPAAALLDDPLLGLDASSLSGVVPLIRSALGSWGCAILAAAPDISSFAGLGAAEVPMPARQATPAAAPGGL